MLNRIIVIGRLVRNPELRDTKSGKVMTTFCVACDRDFAPFGEEKETDFINVITFGKTAESCARYLSKGKLAAVEGRLQIRRYENADGEKRTATEIVANAVQFLSPKSEGGEPVSPTDEGEMSPLDDIPFD